MHGSIVRPSITAREICASWPVGRTMGRVALRLTAIAAVPGRGEPEGRCGAQRDGSPDTVRLGSLFQREKGLDGLRDAPVVIPRSGSTASEEAAVKAHAPEGPDPRRTGCAVALRGYPELDRSGIPGSYHARTIGKLSACPEPEPHLGAPLPS